ncbi:MAG: adenylate kinase, partial [Gemmatimonadota bacterium]
DVCGAALTHRADDDPETVRNRLEVYRRQTEPLVAYYESRGTDLRRLDGDRPVETVQSSLIGALGREGGR